MKTDELIKAVSTNNIDQVVSLLKQTDVNKKDQYGRSPLMMVKKNIEIAKVLLNAGADVNIVSASGYSPLHYAAADCDIELMELLINAGAEIDEPTQYGITPFLNICSNSLQGTTINQAIDLLISHGADIHKADVRNRGAIALAVYHVKYDIIPDLLKYPLDQTLTTCVGRRRHLIFETGDINYLKKYFDAGVDINNCDCNDETLLFKSIKAKQISLTLFLINEHANINHKNYLGQTPIMVAAHGYDKEFCMLLEAGADLLITDNQGNTAIDYLQNKELLPLLEKKLLELDTDSEYKVSPGL